jgi:transcriptional regulator with AAA-type ATPase domain
VEAGAEWNRYVDSRGLHANITRLTERAGELAERCRGRLAAGCRASETELALYEDLVLFALYHRYFDRMTTILTTPAGTKPAVGEIYRAFAADAGHFLQLPGVRLPGGESAQHLFACFFQIRRAFHHIFTAIIGSSPPACRLRGAAWESIFTHDLRRYRRALYARMGDVATLITGPSGTGKELVARAIGLSRYIPFDPRKAAFEEDFAGSFHALNLSALSAALIESELFGHRRGSFTGALEDRAGWLEICRPLGTVFLDEVGEIDPRVQVKLLRVLQTRTFQRLGDTRSLSFLGKVIAATNRDLVREMREGRFREDFYYRICSDIVTTPPLHELLAGSPRELRDLVLFIARRVAGEEAESLAGEVEAWIEGHLGPDYAWPGNFRELEQCVRNVMVRGAYRPAVSRVGEDDLVEDVRAGRVSAEELLRRYCTRVYAETGSYEETARRIGMDRRTVKSRVDRALLERLSGVVEA